MLSIKLFVNDNVTQCHLTLLHATYHVRDSRQYVWLTSGNNRISKRGQTRYITRPPPTADLSLLLTVRLELWRNLLPYMFVKRVQTVCRSCLYFCYAPNGALDGRARRTAGGRYYVTGELDRCKIPLTRRFTSTGAYARSGSLIHGKVPVILVTNLSEC
jgi:hypothetical protein